MSMIIKKELLMLTRYKMQTINIYLFPFFLIAPYILVSEYYQIEGNILMNMIMWVWLCQLLFGISNGIGELRIEGTFSNIIMGPCGLTGYLFYKYIFHIIDCSIITTTTLILSKVFLNVTVDHPLLFILECIVFSLGLFAFGMFFAVLVLRYKRVKSLNYFLQQIFGFLSGYTNDVYKFPSTLRFFSFLIPLTYAIVFFNKTYTNELIFIFLLVITILYLVIGNKLLNKELNNMRKKGEIEQW